MHEGIQEVKMARECKCDCRPVGRNLSGGGGGGSFP